MPLEPKNVVLIGAGHMAYHLGKSLKRSNNKLLKVINRSSENGERLAFELGCQFSTDFNSIPEETDVVIIAVKDDAVKLVAGQIDCPKTIVAHTSGSVPMSALENSSDKIGVFYPLQTMHREVEVNMKEVPFCIEGNSKWNEGVLLELARSLSENVQILNSEQRKISHIAAVFACNFTNHFYALSEEILEKNGMSLDILKPLIKKTAANILTDHPKALQTGPAKRNDTKVMQEHLELLSPELKKLYQDVSESIIQTHKK
ncbi:DUF2520 domain-containing protein [Flavobacteriales bacterium]|nr:DUF2520 domain-containing protein [Flavobacteriales bacterium]